MITYADYLMILSPPEKIKELIKSYKQKSTSIIGNYDGMHSIPHIIVNDRLHRQKPFMIEPIILMLEKKLKTLPPIILCVDGIGAFNHGNDHRTIYADIKSTHSTKMWFRQLKKIINNHSFIKPHITINKTISTEAYNKLWPHLAEFKPVELFRIDKLTVLRRDTFARNTHWEVFAEFPFESNVLFEEKPEKQSGIKPVKQNTATNQQISLF